MAAEIEIKLALAPGDAAAVRRHPLLAGQRPRRTQLLNTYYDTPDLELRRAGLALRLRRSGRRWLQTLKGGGGSGGGLHRRDEWEYPLAGPELDLSRFADTPLARLMARKGFTLNPVFATDFQRTTWQLTPRPGTRIEVALDQGAIKNGHALALCEVELELLEGDAALLFETARALQDAAPLRPEAVSKAERGYRLATGRRLAPVKAAPSTLNPGLTAAAGLRAVVETCLAQIMANAEGVAAARARGQAEFVHQMRVGVRRLRSVLKLAQKTDVTVRPLLEELKWLAAVLGSARDWDVLVEHTLPPVLEAYDDATAAAPVENAALRRRVARRARPWLRRATTGCCWIWRNGCTSPRRMP